MKKLILNIAFIAFGTGLMAQDAIDSFFSQYEQSEDFTKVNISGKMFQLFAHIEGETEEEKELLEAISKIDRLRIISGDNISGTTNIYDSAVKAPSKDYEVLMTLEDKDEDVTIFVKEISGVIAELLMIARGSNDLVIMTLTGEIDLNQVARISRAMDIEGLDYLEKMD